MSLEQFLNKDNVNMLWDVISDEDILNVVQYYHLTFAKFIHAQMRDKWWQEADEGYEVLVSRGYQSLANCSYITNGDEQIRNVHQPLLAGEKDKIGSMVFGDFKRCLYPIQKFGSDSERAFASLLENDTFNNKWFKPSREQFQINYRDEQGTTANYEPDFVVETDDGKFLFEPKQQNQMNDFNVLAKASAAVEWCKNASKHEAAHKHGKPWSYILIPHTAILSSATIKGLIQQYKK